MWKPTASLKNLQARAKLLAATRQFFKERDIIEVDTPVLGQAPVTDPFLAALETKIQSFPNKTFYLQTSPEYYQKRLLAAYGVSCYQLGKCFRDDEYGCIHSPEFTMLEWYHLGFDDAQLMAEVEELIGELCKVICHPDNAQHSSGSRYNENGSFKTGSCGLLSDHRMTETENVSCDFWAQSQLDKLIKCLSYQEAFQTYLQIDPHQASLESLQAAVKPFYDGVVDRDTALQILMSEVIERKLANLANPVFIYDFPASQAALAQIKTLNDGTKVAARFELYWRGVELGNGYHELIDAKEQEARFKADLAKRKELKLKPVPIDTNLIAALEEGHLPPCAGIAIGFDRLVMVLLNETSLATVQSFFEF